MSMWTEVKVVRRESVGDHRLGRIMVVGATVFLFVCLMVAVFSVMGPLTQLGPLHEAPAVISR